MALCRLPAEFTPGGLKKTLQLFGLDISAWGKGEAKSLEDYYKELQAGESVIGIDSHGMYRKISVVKMLIEDPERGVLIEDYQILPDGRRRERGQPPGGKICANEMPIEALFREMSEELNLGKGDFTPVFYDTHGERRNSKSFPGLDTFYEIHTAKVALHSHVVINDGHEVADKEDGKKLFFRWKKE